MNATTLSVSAAEPARTALTVGPVLYHWSRAALMSFYADLADGPADTVVLGEVVPARSSRARAWWAAFGSAKRIRLQPR